MAFLGAMIAWAGLVFLRFRAVIPRSDWRFLAPIAMCFGAMLLVDLNPITHGEAAVFLEDGAKWVGTFILFAYAVFTCRREIECLIAPAAAP